MATEMHRMWVNQPSTLQPHHNLHGVCVLACEERPGTMRVYFLSGPVISMEMATTALSHAHERWPKNDADR